MLDFLNYIKENYNEDVTSTEAIIKTKWDKVVAIIKEAFDDEYADKRTALHRIKNEFTDTKTAPKSIDIDFLKENLDYVVDKINSLNEGEIRITINNDVDKGSKTPSLGMESTGKKRGRPKKDIVEEETEEPNEEEKVVKVSIEGTKVVVEPSENTGLEKSEHEFESEDEANSFADSLSELFQGFKVEKEEAESTEETEETEEAEEEVAPKIYAKLATEAKEEENTETEEMEDAEETEDSEEMEDAEETEDAEEQEDSVNWEDVVDFGSDEEAEEEMSMNKIGFSGSKMYDLNSIDLTKLLDKMVRVDEDWYRVTAITEDNKIMAVDKNKKESEIDLEQIEEMEYEDAEEECGSEEECMVSSSEEELTGEEYKVGQEVLYQEKPYMIDAIEGDIAYLSDEDGAEIEAPLDQLEVIGMGTSEEELEEPVDAEEEIDDLEAEEEVEEVEEGLSFAKLANRYMDGDPIEEDSLTAPSMIDTAKGLTSHPSKPGEKLEKVPAAPKASSKPGPTGSYTKSPSKPKEKLEPSGKVPKSDKKAAPSGSYTKSPSKPKETVEKVPAPNIPSEYKKGGAKG